MKDSYIVHLDMDAFFAAVEQREHPPYQGKPVVVGADPKGGRGRGVVATCSYEARKYGIRSAMPISLAYQKCPHAIYLRGNSMQYRAVSKQIFSLLYQFTPHIQPVSIDEAFLDITSTFHLFGTPRETCLQIKKRIQKDIGLTASIGLAPTKMAAKIASDLKKPNGFVEVTQKGLLKFLWPLDIQKIWGLGKKSEKKLRQMGIQTIGELAQTSTDELKVVFGKSGLHYWELANGIDEGKVMRRTEIKSVSHERTFSEDIINSRRIESVLMYLCEKVSSRLRKKGLKGKTITLKVRLQGFETFTRSETLSEATNFVEILFPKAKKLFLNFNRQEKKIRLVGVKVSNLSSGGFDEFLFQDIHQEKLEKVHEATEKIHERYGMDFLHRARNMDQ